ncbi:group II intron maturase-specific domain-containing protein [Bradyrhizobium sp. 187]|uniref:group II intron maturase-specific domain-containing protein n=1 Tax=Bradyrhizobium sp. 187 TaxID=2782655 RepID=UPI002000087F|nr:group II intron maturase-specific domain-containing protein [Bradyrhizobium sp. 187]
MLSLGWKAYFRLAQTSEVWRELDEWLRHRLRAIQLKHWKPGTTVYRELQAMGAKRDVARQVAASSRRWWRNSGMLLNVVLPLNWSNRLGLSRLHDLNFANRRCGPACRVVWQGCDPQGRPLCRCS